MKMEYVCMEYSNPNIFLENKNVAEERHIFVMLQALKLCSNIEN